MPTPKTKQFIEEKIKELRDEFAMGNDQTTILGAKGSADRIADFFSKVLADLNSLWREGVKEIVPEERVFELRKDNPQYSLGQTNGHYICRDQILKNLEELK